MRNYVSRVRWRTSVDVRTRHIESGRSKKYAVPLITRVVIFDSLLE